MGIDQCKSEFYGKTVTSVLKTMINGYMFKSVWMLNIDIIKYNKQMRIRGKI